MAEQSFLGNDDKNPLVLNERQSDINFNYLQSYSIIGNYTIPYVFAFEELPHNIQIIMADSSIAVKRTIAANSNSVTFNLKIDIKRQQYFVEEYANIKEFYKKMFALLAEKIVVKKQ